MGNIEDTHPISALAERVWAGPLWHYPHIEQMCKEMRELRAAVRVLAEYVASVEAGASVATICHHQEMCDSNPIAAAAVREAGR